MFEKINVFNTYSDVIYKEVYRDRHKYLKYFEEADKYIAENEIIVTGTSAFKILIGEDLNPNEFSYHLMCRNVFNHAKALASIFYRATENMYIYVQTKIMNIEVSIFIDERELFTLSSIDTTKAINIFSIINPIKTKGLYHEESLVNVVSPELLLIDMYRYLSFPFYAKKWEEYTDIMLRLFERFESRADDIISGSAEIEDDDDHTPEFTGSRETKKDHNKQMIHLWGNRYVSSLPAHTIAEQLGADEFYEDYSIKIPTDFRLRRVTFYKSRQPIAYVYNSMQYDLIINSYYNCLHFLFIDLWILQMVTRAGKLTPPVAKKIKEELIDIIKEKQAKVMEIIKKDGKLARDLFPDDYHGIYYNETIAKKKQMIESRGDAGPIPNWYPAINIVLSE
jgi:hypothetical protein